MAKDLNWLSKYYKNEGKIMNLIEQSSKDEIRYINVSEVLKDVVTIVEHKKDLIHPSLRKNPIVRGIHSGRNTYITYIICTLITECTMGSEEAIGWTLDLLEKYPLKINGKWTKAKISSIFFRRLQAAKP